MGRLPLQFAGRDIAFRFPFNMYAEMTQNASTKGQVFPDGAFLHNVDKPFEIHRMFIKLTAIELQSAGPGVFIEMFPDPQPTTSEQLVTLRIHGISNNENITKARTRVDSLVEKNTGTIEYEDPYTLVRGEGLQVTVDVDALPTICIGDPDELCDNSPVGISRMRTQINLQGYLLIVAPPTETR
jgi:hypothetical protein